MTKEEDDDEGEGRDEGKALGCGGEQQVGLRVKPPTKTRTNPSFHLFFQLLQVFFS